MGGAETGSMGGATVRERKTPAKEDAGMRETRNARKRVRIARIARIALLLAGLKTGSLCTNAAPGIMLLRGNRTGNNPRC
jgi:hypothetical protein